MWRAVLLGLLFVSAEVVAEGFPVAEDLSRVAAVARDRGVPILMVFGASDCVYCRRLEQEVLLPMEVAGETSVVVAEIHIDSEAPMKDFDGAPTTGESLGARYRVEFTPTVYLLDPEGRALGRPIVGYNPSFYEAYLEAAIQSAQARLGGG